MSMKSMALITGASTGIATVYADRLAARGHDLVLVARDTARLEANAQQLRSRNGIAVDINTAGLIRAKDLASVEVDVRVDAALAGFDRRETVTIPTLPDAGQWTAFEVACTAMIPNFMQKHSAERYRKAG